MTDRERQVSNSFIYLLALVSTYALPLVTLPLFTRILPPADFGVIALAEVYAVFMCGVINFGLLLSFQRNYFEYRNDPRGMAQLLYSILVFVMANFLVVSVPTYLYADAISGLLGFSDPNRILFWAFCANFVAGINLYFFTYFKNSENASSFAKYTLGTSVLNAVFAVYFVVVLKTGVIGIVRAELIATSVMFLFFIGKFLRRYPFSLNMKILGEALKLGWPLMPKVFFGTVGTQFDKYIIGLLSTLGSVGIFSIGQRIANVGFIFMTALQNVFSPQVNKRMFELKETGGQDIGRYLTPFVYISVAFGLGVILFSEEILHVLLPRSYEGTVDIVVVLTMYYSTFFFGKVNGDQLLFMKKTYVSSAMSLLNLALMIGLNILFVRKWGAIGAAWATFIAGLVCGYLMFKIAQRHYAVAWEYRRVLAMFGMLFGAGAAVIVLRHLEVFYPIRLAVKISFGVVFAYLGVRLHVISKDNIQVVTNVLKPAYATLFGSKRAQL